MKYRLYYRARRRFRYIRQQRFLFKIAGDVKRLRLQLRFIFFIKTKYAFEPKPIIGGKQRYITYVRLIPKPKPTLFLSKIFINYIFDYFQLIKLFYYI